MKRIASIFMAAVLTVAAIFGYCTPVQAAGTGKEVKIIYTSDIHDYYDTTSSVMPGDKIVEHGGAAKVKTIIDQTKNENSVVLDAGDFSMGTLLQAGYATDAYELRLLGQMGIEYTTFGNHEFDFGPAGLSSMLQAAMKSGDPLPKILTCNLNRTGDLKGEVAEAAKTLEEYGVKDYEIKEINGVKVALFGLMGPDSVSDAPTAGFEFTDYLEAAKKTVADIGDKADLVVCISHSGINASGEKGDDITLAKKVSGIDVIISGHAHNSHDKAIQVNDTLIVDSGCYLASVGELTLNVGEGGKVLGHEYKLHPLEGVDPNKAIQDTIEAFKKNIEATYLKAYNLKYDQVIAKSKFNFTSLDEMYATHAEYPMGELIADSYMYEAEKNGVDLDVAVVGLGTIRGTFAKGDITVAKAFEMCSLGVGGDGSAGHPIIVVNVKGKDLKLLAELDASLGNFVSSIKMSYSGLQMKYNNARMLLDRVTDVKFVNKGGGLEEFEDERLYKVSLNMYAANMIGMLNSLTKGLLSVTPLDENGEPIKDLYAFAMKDKEGREVKEWIALVDYLQSFEKEDGVSVIPAAYEKPQDRKVSYIQGGLAVIDDPGLATILVIIVPIIIILLIVLIIHGIRKGIKKIKKKRRGKKAAAKE